LSEKSALRQDDRKMGNKVTKKLFEKVTAEEAARHFSALGFAESEPGAFTRKCGAVVHGFGFTPNPSFTHFHMPVGAYLPSLNARLDYVAFGGPHYPTLLVSRWLGEFNENFTRHDYYFHFASLEQLREKFPKVYSDFVEQAEPWLAGLTTVGAVAREFHKWRLAPPEPGVVRPPDPFAWATYGWLLQEADQQLEGQQWLEQSLDQLKEPAFYVKGAHFVPIGTPGARPIPRRPEELRLIEMLKRDLGTKDEIT
jgi:hypothetical protein